MYTVKIITRYKAMVNDYQF